MRDSLGPYAMHAACPDCPSTEADHWPIICEGDPIIGVGRCRVCRRVFAWSMGAP